MIVLDARVVIPRALVTETLRTLSRMYQGTSKMRQRARLSVYWPHMDIDIANAPLLVKIESACFHPCPPSPFNVTNRPLVHSNFSTQTWVKMSVDTS